jgi:cell wall-associated NlpC family hydrolase
MKELLLIGTTVFALTTGGVTAATSSQTPERPERGAHVSVARINQLEIKAQDAIDAAKMEQLRENTIEVDKAIEKLSTHVNKTWYVFSGTTPEGWDCSGLTLWFYEQLGIELEHRASIQGRTGQKTNDPKPGDLVVFKYNGYNSAYHVGIYIGNGEMIHAPKRGHLTRIESVESFGGEYSNISYRKLINTIG